MSRVKMTLLASAAAGAVVWAGAAVAADLPLKAPPPVVRAFSWTGCYVGAHWGWGWGKKTGQGLSEGVTTDYGTFNNDKMSGPIFGGQLGCNYQFVGTNFVIGVEGQYSAADINGIGTTANSTHGWIQSKFDGIGSVTGKLGWNGWDPMVLFYVKGGWAAVHERDFTKNTNFSDSRYPSFTNDGWTIGGGAEWAFSFAPRWSAFVEYMHYDFKKKNVAYTSPNFSIDWKPRVDTVKVGVNYRLWSQY